ncbi:FadR/GntR family transcriptional regulator [Pseudomonas lopnurensis]|uniref:FadR/GntR family transcriptional regulator n=1 Tax=Pseudomonas lopnurensis TaxID=1477517 RepID=UPI0028A9BBF0|nr:FCD domain-containing protein [Pseudomonas lopnurensis]
MSDNKNGSAVGRAERALRSRILASADGAFLGSEQQMLESLGVSRPTFRQVAKLLERDHLLEIRRGVGGGFYACNPSIEAVAQAASVFLQFEKATLSHATLAAAQLSREVVRLAAQCQDATLRQRLQQFVDVDKNALGQPCAVADFIQSELAFVELISAMSGNPVIKLLISILYNFATPAVGGVIFDDAAYMHTSREIRISTAEAILIGDGELAMLMFRRHMDGQYSRLKSLRGEAGLDVPLF